MGNHQKGFSTSRMIKASPRGRDSFPLPLLSPGSSLTPIHSTLAGDLSKWSIARISNFLRKIPRPSQAAAQQIRGFPRTPYPITVRGSGDTISNYRAGVAYFPGVSSARAEIPARESSKIRLMSSRPARPAPTSVRGLCISPVCVPTGIARTTAYRLTWRTSWRSGTGSGKARIRLYSDAKWQLIMSRSQ